MGSCRPHLGPEREASSDYYLLFVCFFTKALSNPFSFDFFFLFPTIQADHQSGPKPHHSSGSPLKQTDHC